MRGFFTIESRVHGSAFLGEWHEAPDLTFDSEHQALACCSALASAQPHVEFRVIAQCMKPPSGLLPISRTMRSTLGVDIHPETIAHLAYAMAANEDLMTGFVRAVIDSKVPPPGHVRVVRRVPDGRALITSMQPDPDHLREAIGGSLAQAVPLPGWPKRVRLYCPEDGVRQGLPVNLALPWGADLICGPVVVANADEAGDLIDLPPYEALLVVDALDGLDRRQPLGRHH